MDQSAKLADASVVNNPRITVRGVAFNELYENRTLGQVFLTFVKSRIVFKYAHAFSKDYQGDFWKAWQLSNGGAFMTPKTRKNYPICVPGNFYEGNMSAEAFGITVSLFALGEISWTTEQDADIDAYHALRDFALDHAEATAIMAAID